MVRIRLCCPDCAVRCRMPRMALLAYASTSAPRAHPGRIWWICSGCDDLVATRVGPLRLAWLRSADAFVREPTWCRGDPPVSRQLTSPWTPIPGPEITLGAWPPWWVWPTL